MKMTNGSQGVVLTKVSWRFPFQAPGNPHVSPWTLVGIPRVHISSGGPCCYPVPFPQITGALRAGVNHVGLASGTNDSRGGASVQVLTACFSLAFSPFVECGQLRSWEQGGVRREGRCVSRVRRMSGCSLGNLRCATCLGSPSEAWKRISGQSSSERSVFIKNKEQRQCGHRERSGSTSCQTRESRCFWRVSSQCLWPRDEANSCWNAGVRWLLRALCVTTGVDGFAYYGVRKPTGGIGGLLAPITKGLSQLQRSPWFWALLQWPWCKASHPVTLGRTPQGLLREARVKVTEDKRVQGSQWWPCFQKPVSEEMQLLNLLTGAHRHGSHTHLNKRSGSIRWRWHSLGNFSTENQPGTLGWQRVP